MDLITQNCPGEREDERHGEVARSDERGGTNEEDKPVEGKGKERGRDDGKTDNTKVKVLEGEGRGGGCSRKTDGKEKREGGRANKTQGLRSAET